MMSDTKNEIPQICVSEILDIVYCKRRWYLRSIEKQSGENNYITEGRILHSDVDVSSVRKDGDTVLVTNAVVYSNVHNLYGYCDLIQFEPLYNGVSVPYCDYKVEIIPVEYKHGKVRNCNEYNAQVVAYAMCLEEMYGCKINKGLIYFAEEDSYVSVDMTDFLRKVVENSVEFVKNYDNSVIKAFYSRKCRGCSMLDTCRPKELNISDYIEFLWKGDI